MRAGRRFCWIDATVARYPFLGVLLRLGWGVTYYGFVVPLVFMLLGVPVWIGLQAFFGAHVENFALVFAVVVLARFAVQRRYAR